MTAAQTQTDHFHDACEAGTLYHLNIQVALSGLADLLSAISGFKAWVDDVRSLDGGVMFWLEADTVIASEDLAKQHLQQLFDALPDVAQAHLGHWERASIHDMLAPRVIDVLYR